MTKPGGVLAEEWTFAETMWKSTKELKEMRDPQGEHIWRIIERQYPGDKQKQTRFLGFFKDTLDELKRRKPEGLSHSELIGIARKWDVVDVVREEMLTVLFGRYY